MKRSLAMLLCLVMVVTMLPVGVAFADEGEEPAAVELTETLPEEDVADEPGEPEEPGEPADGGEGEEEIIGGELPGQIVDPLDPAAAPAAPATLNAERTPSGVKLTWAVAPGTDQYRVFRKNGTKWDTLGDTLGTFYVDTKAANAKSYTYAVKGMSADGKTLSGFSPEVTIVYYKAATPTATVVWDKAGAKVEWGACEGAVKYRVFRKIAPATTWTKIADVTVTTYIDASASSDKDNAYAVRCLDSAGTLISEQSAEVSLMYYKFMPGPAVTEALDDNGGVRINWEIVDGATKYRVFRKVVSGDWVKLEDTAATTALDIYAVSGEKYEYAVRVISSDGKTFLSDYGASKSITFGAASLCQVDKLSNVQNGVLVEWTAITGADKYLVERKMDGSSVWVKVGESTTTSLEDTDVVSGKKYTYRVRALKNDDSLVGGYDSTGKVIQYIAAPKLVSAVGENGGIKITWEASAGAAKYRVVRKNGAIWDKLADVTTTSYVDKTVDPGVKYTYSVVCVDNTGSAETSAMDLTGKTAAYYGKVAVSSLEVTETGVKITWEKAAGCTSYRIQRRIGDGNWAAIYTVTGNEYTDTSVTGTTTYTYRVLGRKGSTVVNTYDKVGKSITVFDTPELKDPERKNDTIILEWVGVQDCLTYRVMRKAGSGSWQSQGDVAGTRYEDSKIASGIEYTYKVCCLDENGKMGSLYSAEKKAVFYDAPFVTGIACTTTGAKITWAPVEGVKKYRIYYKTGAESWKFLRDVTGKTEGMHLGAKSDTKYSYTVCCLNDAGTEEISSYDEFGLSITFYAAPVLSSINSNNDGVKINWKKVTGVNTYRIYRRTGSGGFSTLIDVTTTAANPTYTDTTAEVGKQYSYTVACLSAGGGLISGYFTEDAKILTTRYYPAPELPTVEAKDGHVLLTWKAVDGVSKYRIYRKVGTNAWSKLVDVNSSEASITYKDTTTESNKQYTYTIRCLDSASKFISGYNDTGKGLLYLATPALQGVSKKVDGSTGSVTVTWKTVDGASGYQIWRHAEGETNWTRIDGGKVKDGSTSSYVDTTVVVGKTYYYTVRAMNGSNVSWYQDPGLSIKVD